MSTFDATTRERFWAKVFYAPDGCWYWTGHVTRLGYGSFGRNQKAHRVSYELANGPVPEGLVIDHLCRTRTCVRPEHLRAVTQGENVHAPGSLCLAALLAARTHCAQGHPFDNANTLIRADRPGRRCRECERLRSRKRYLSKENA